jgi:hypothetical protein
VTGGPVTDGPVTDAPGPEATAGPARRGRVVAGRVVTGAAAALVLAGLLMPDRPDDPMPAALLRLPAEGLLAAALVLALPARARRPAAVVAGAVLGLLAVAKALDLGFLSVLARPFDPVLDWPLLGAGMGFLTEEFGRAGAVAAAAGAVVLGLAVLVLMPLAVVRLTGPLHRHRTAAGRAVAALAAVWIACALLGAQLVPGAPVAGHNYHRVLQVGTSLQDHREFAAAAAVDAYRDTPGSQLLTGLRGRDVVVAFVESYGRDAVTDPELAAQVGAVLRAGDRRLRRAGFDSRSGFLTSPTVGGASWLAHATLLSGLWVDNQQRYRSLVGSDRLTLNRAFQRAGWRTVAVMPGILKDWPEGEFFGYDQVYDADGLGYRGERMNWGRIPDQYTLSAFQRFERDRADHPPVMAEIPLLSSHVPWVPRPSPVGWEEVGDGSVFGPEVARGGPVEEVLGDPARVRAAYREAIGYSLDTLISYLETYGDDDLVLVFLGDHQPAPLVTGEGASPDVPVTIVARDRAVLDRVAGWGWSAGLRPDPDAPVWSMDAFRDRFLAAFGPPGHRQ